MDGKAEILAAIGAIADRLESIEKRLTRVEDQGTSTARSVDKIEQRVNAVARHLLTPQECAGLGIVDARPRGGSSTSPPPVAMAAKGGDE